MLIHLYYSNLCAHIRLIMLESVFYMNHSRWLLLVSYTLLSFSYYLTLFVCVDDWNMAFPRYRELFLPVFLHFPCRVLAAKGYHLGHLYHRFLRLRFSRVRDPSRLPLRGDLIQAKKGFLHSTHLAVKNCLQPHCLNTLHSCDQ